MWGILYEDIWYRYYHFLNQVTFVWLPVVRIFFFLCFAGNLCSTSSLIFLKYFFTMKKNLGFQAWFTLILPCFLTSSMLLRLPIILKGINFLETNWKVRLCAGEKLKLHKIQFSRNRLGGSMSGWRQRRMFHSAGAKNLGLSLGGRVGGAPCIGYRTISFSVKIQSPFLCSEMAQLDHLGYFMQHFKN